MSNYHKTRLVQKIVRRKASGFTLVEVLVALVIVSISLTALLSGMGGYASYQTSLRDRFWSQNVAWNELSKVHVAQEVGGLTNIVGSGSVKQFGVNWRWTIDKENTATETIIRLNASVTPDSNNKGSRLSTMVMKGGGFSRIND